MKNFCRLILIVFVILEGNAQGVDLPNDFRQQNLSEFNSSLLNPAYSLDRNNPSSVALWTRWQWQNFDSDPTSLFFNYTAKLNDVSAGGVGFFQHNTGVFLNTGAVLNYAYNISLDDRSSLSFGLNVFGYQQKLADSRFFVPNPIQTNLPNDFIVQVAPGINLKVDKFNIGVTSENLLDFNITEGARNSGPEDRILQALASYDFELSILKANRKALLRPSVYYKSTPGVDSQVGIQTLFSTEKYWLQSGYNSFYGISGGIGGRFFKRLSVGVVIEVASNTKLKGQKPSFEFVTSYKLGKLKTSEEKIEEELLAEKEKEEELLAEKEEQLAEELSKAEKLATKEGAKEQERLNRLKEKRVKDSIRLNEKSIQLAEKQYKKDVKRKKDSIRKAEAEAVIVAAKMLEDKKIKAKQEAIVLAQKRKQDSITEVNNTLAAIEKERLEKESAELALKNEVVNVQSGEKYEEVSKQGVLEPGYYLIANVFGTKKYFEAFMVDVKKKGLNPDSFYREMNKYIYVYLGKYNSIKSARAARDSKLDGKYTDDLWIFRVKGE